jgi:hypothetical protein
VTSKKLILDTSVCIDLYNGNLLKATLRLPYEFVLPDVIIAELKEPRGEYLLKLGFLRESFPGDAIQNIIELRSGYSGPSTNDLFALLLAKRNSCQLITGDNLLRRASVQEGVSTHGLLWLMDRMVESRLLNGEAAVNALENIIREGSWLPKKDCEERFKKWKDL